MLNVSLLPVLLVACAAYLVVCDRCCTINYHVLPRYKLMKSNSRSRQPILSRREISSVKECERFAASRKALAFNFISARDRLERRENMCQALQCPEDHNMTTLERERHYKYYSMYPAFVPPANTTVECIPKTGMFVFSSGSSNYTQAQSFCRDWGMSLAHVISEERTEGLAKFVSPRTPRYVGLSNRDKERLWKNEFGEPLSCFDYRAWGEGQPSHSKGCVALVHSPRNGPPPSWIVVPCHVSLPFICEISPLPSSSRRRRDHRA